MIPPNLPCKLSIAVRQADWPCEADRQQLQCIRQQVFQREQHISAADEWDDQDAKPSCEHFLAFCPQQSQAIACLRLLKDDDQHWKFGRVAVLANYRRQYVAKHMLALLIQIATAQSVKTLRCDAQISAIRLYQQLGFTCCSEVFLDAGIEHQRMSITLN